jgi:hypothetical protein
MFEGKNVITILARLIVKLFNAVRSGNIINFLYRLKKLRKSKKIPKSDITLIIVAHILAPLPLVLKCSCSSAGKIPDFRDQVGFDSSPFFLGSRGDSGFVRLRPEPFGSRT